MKFSQISIIIGTQKGGTTSLFNYISQHPQVSASKVKETNFFLEDQKWSKGINYYQDLYQWEPEVHAIALEASPNYTNSLENINKVIQRMQTVEIKYKFIYLLRNPIQKVESMRKQGVYQGWYAEALKQETADSLPPSVIESVQYATIIDSFVNSFSRDQILLLRTDELRGECISSTLANKVCPFLGIEPTFQFSTEKIHNSQNSYRTDTVWHFLREARQLSYVKNLVPDFIKNTARDFLSKPLNQHEISVPPLTDKQKDFIRASLNNEGLRLKTEYGLDLSNWDLN